MTELLLKNKKKDSASPAIAGDNLPLPLTSASESPCSSAHTCKTMGQVAMMKAVTGSLANEFAEHLTLSRAELSEAARDRASHTIDLSTYDYIVDAFCSSSNDDCAYTDSENHFRHDNDLSPLITYLIGEFSWGSTTDPLESVFKIVAK